MIVFIVWCVFFSVCMGELCSIVSVMMNVMIVLSMSEISVMFFDLMNGMFFNVNVLISVMIGISSVGRNSWLLKCCVSVLCCMVVVLLVLLDWLWLSLLELVIIVSVIVR